MVGSRDREFREGDVQIKNCKWRGLGTGLEWRDHMGG